MSTDRYCILPEPHVRIFSEIVTASQNRNNVRLPLFMNQPQFKDCFSKVKLFSQMNNNLFLFETRSDDIPVY